MPSFVPRLEWNDIEIEGDSSIGSPTITGIADTSEVVVGMIISHADFPVDTEVISKTANSITLSEDSLGTSTDEVFDLFERVTMDFPCPTEDSEEQVKANTSVSSSVAGQRQVQRNYLEGRLDQEYRNLTPAKFTQLRDRFFSAWASYGRTFRWFESYEDTANFREYELDVQDFDPKRAIPKNNDFLYKVKFRFRRVI